ncbi:MAG: NADH-quinone oxidoreductase subunit A [Nitrososphaerota archaeon]|jgi:NADH:ubiquinone oxidoreductase subunit 3 (subunit A)|nr:NADH-quinone oxidoreductase subunit A [Nitrososphaerota archaeon]
MPDFPLLITAMCAFILIFISAYAIYAIGRHLAPKTKHGVNHEMGYACGEKVVFSSPKMNISLYKYLIYFVVFDSAILLLSFASIAIASINPILVVLYLGIILAAGFILLDGGKD